MARHCGRALHGVAAPRALINDCRCLFRLSTALPRPRAASQHQLSTPRAWLCGCSPGIQSAIQELGEARGDVQCGATGARSHTHHFSVLSAENNNLFCAHWAQLYIIRAQKLFGCFWAAGCLHRWRTGYGDCGLSAAGDSVASDQRQTAVENHKMLVIQALFVTHVSFQTGNKKGTEWQPSFQHMLPHRQESTHCACVETKWGSLPRVEWPAGQHEALSICKHDGGLDKLSWTLAETEDTHSQNLPPL